MSNNSMCLSKIWEFCCSVQCVKLCIFVEIIRLCFLNLELIKSHSMDDLSDGVLETCCGDVMP